MKFCAARCAPRGALATLVPNRPADGAAGRGIFEEKKGRVRLRSVWQVAGGWKQSGAFPYGDRERRLGGAHDLSDDIRAAFCIAAAGQQL